jgi:hypothetical protein
MIRRGHDKMKERSKFGSRNVRRIHSPKDIEIIIVT